MNLNVPILVSAGAIGVCYFFVRILGKYIGAYAGAVFSGASTEIKNFLGLALVPQAGVSIGLAALGQRILPDKMGVLLSTIILSSGVLYEMVGPACAKASLFLSNTIKRKTPVIDVKVTPAKDEKQVRVKQVAFPTEEKKTDPPPRKAKKSKKKEKAAAHHK